MKNEPKTNGKELAIARNEKGQVLPGVVLNPAGRPKGSKHMATLLLEAVKRVAKGSGTSEDVEIVSALVKKAKKGDTKAIEIVFDRLDGKAPASLDITSDGEAIGSSKEIQELTHKLNELYREK